MTRIRVNCFALSLDGYGAGPRQDLENPLGVGGMAGTLSTAKVQRPPVQSRQCR